MPRLLHVQTFGQGPPLFILHGFLGSGDNWRTMANRLGETHTVYTVDARNHGKSFHDPLTSYEVMAADLLVLMDSLGHPKAAFLGHSMGGKTAMHLAIAHPERVEKLVVVDIAPRSYGFRRRTLAAMRSLDLSAYPTFTSVEQALSSDIFDRSERQFLMKNLKRSENGFFWQIGLEELWNSYDQISADLKLSGKYKGPSLFVKGGKSDYLTEADWPGIAAHFPNARLEILTDVGHWVQSEAPDAFIAAVRPFLAAR